MPNSRSQPRRPARGAVGTPATIVLSDANIRYKLHPYSHDPATDSYGLEAAAAMGVPPQQVFKTLVTDVDGTLIVAVVPVSGQLHLKSLATAVGGKKAVMAEASVAERATGYVVGGISPIGQRGNLPVVLDHTALDYETVFVSGGRRGLDVEISPDDLISLTNARVAAISRPRAPRQEPV